MPDGELRRCTVPIRKPVAEKHYQQGKHSYKIAQANDSAFPDHRRQQTLQPPTDGATAAVRRETSVLAGRLDIAVTSVARPPFRSFGSQLLQTGAELSRLCLGLNFQEVAPPWSATAITNEMIAAALESFQRQAVVIVRDVRFVNFICDADTILLIEVVHSGLANPTASRIFYH
jgi:hypothetical protein